MIQLAKRKVFVVSGGGDRSCLAARVQFGTLIVPKVYVDESPLLYRLTVHN
jgi:hypothetical protein